MSKYTKDKPSAATALRPLAPAELQKRVREAREELLSLRLKKATGAVENPARFRALRRVGGMTYTDEEQRFAERLRKTFSIEGALPLGSEREVQPVHEEFTSGSTDVADVSWVVPTAEFTTATFVPGTPGHRPQTAAVITTSTFQAGLARAACTVARGGVWPGTTQASQASFIAA